MMDTPGIEGPPQRVDEECDSYPGNQVEFLASRRSTPAQFLAGRAPSADELRTMIELAVRVPDHGALTPWRLVLLEGEGKTAFVDGLEDIASQLENAQKARSSLKKLGDAPAAVSVVSRVGSVERIPEREQLLSAGAICMNLLWSAHALGLGANWVTGWYSYDAAAARLLGLEEYETVVGFILVGELRPNKADRLRPSFDSICKRYVGDEANGQR